MSFTELLYEVDDFADTVESLELETANYDTIKKLINWGEDLLRRAQSFKDQGYEENGSYGYLLPYMINTLEAYLEDMDQVLMKRGIYW